MKRATLAMVLLLASAAAGAADDLTLSVFQNATNNLFQTSFPQKDQITSLSFAYAKGSQPFSFFTQGSYSQLYENPAVSSYAQDLGLDYVVTLGPKSALYFALKGGGTLYRAEFDDLNYLSLGVQTSLKSYLSASSILKLDYTFDRRDYRWSLFDSSSHLAHLSVDRYFPSRTTLRVEGNWGYKLFLHPFQAAEGTTVEPIYYHYGGGRGFGGGFGGGAGSGPGGSTSTTPLTSGRAGLQIASVSGLLAQGLGDRFGLQISGLKQWTLSGKNPFGSVDEFYFVENPTYDVFSWNGTALSAQLTWDAPWNTQLKIGYTRFSKEFPGIEAMSLDGVSLGSPRKDARNQWEARFEQNFSKVSVFLAFSYIGNRSNDPLFDWRGHFLSAGFEWNLGWGKDR